MTPSAANKDSAGNNDSALTQHALTARWLEAVTAVSVVIVVIVCLTHAWGAPSQLELLLAVPPALAGIGAATIKRPLIFGAATTLAAVIILAITHDALSTATLVTTVIVTTLAAAATSRSAPGTQHMANVLSVAEAAQRAVLRPLPEHLGPLDLGVVYLAAAADAKVGGDLYDVTSTPYGIRLIIGDVRGKGLGAVDVAADVLGMYREVTHEVHTLAELARRLDAGLSRRWGEHEEFVTALFAEIDPEAGRLTIYSCGHPPAILISTGPDGQTGVEVLEVPAPAPPLGLLTLGDDSGAGRTLLFKPNDQLLFYTDGVTEARDSRRVFYPLDERLAALATPGAAHGAAHTSNDAKTPLLQALRADLLRYVGAPLDDDAALLLVRAPAAWPRPVKSSGHGSRAPEKRATITGT